MIDFLSVDRQRVLDELSGDVGEAGCFTPTSAS